MTWRRGLLVLAVLGLSACGSTDGKRNDGAAGSGAIDAAAGSGGASATGGGGGSAGTGGGTAGTSVGGRVGAGGGSGAPGGAGGAGRGGTGGGGRGGSGGGGASGGRGGAGGGGRGGAGGLAACPRLDTGATPLLPLMHTDGPAPAPMGGEFSGGTYYLTQMMYYGGTATGISCDQLFREVWEVSALSASDGSVRATDVGDGFTNSNGWTYHTDGTTNYTHVATCGLSGTYSVPYTATANQILMFTTAMPSCWDRVTLVFTYTKQ